MPNLKPEEILQALNVLEANASDIEAVKTLKNMLPELKEWVQIDQDLRKMAAEGRKIMAQTATILRGVSDSTASASNEIFEILQHIVYGDQDVVLKGSPQEIRDQLMGAMNALQFQDIVSQQLAAIQALLEAYDQTLAPLADAPLEADLEVGVEGAFDVTASFDRDRVDADDLDAWINQAKDEDGNM